MDADTSGFTAEQERLLETLLDIVIPASSERGMPGAGALGLVSHITQTVRQTPMLRPVVEYGLSTLAELAAERHPGGWMALSAEERTAVFREFAATDQFFQPAFLYLVYSGYYQHPQVVEALGLEPRPPHPEGYQMDAGDFTLLDAVRRRGRMYRDG